MHIDIRRESPAQLAEYARIPSSFEVREVLEPVMLDGGLGGVALVLRQAKAPYRKDYDAEPTNRPEQWRERFDVRHWLCLAAWRGNERIGGAVVAWQTPELGARADTAVLWDLRVAPAVHRQGVGTRLLSAAEAWARGQGARWLQIETQNVNVPACRFYAACGCTLGALNRLAYPRLPEETELIWIKDLGAAG